MELFKSTLIYPKLVKTICVNATLWFCLIAVWKSESWAHGREKGKKVGEKGPLHVRPTRRAVERGRRNHGRRSDVGKSKLTGLTRQHLGLETRACKTPLR